MPVHPNDLGTLVDAGGPDEIPDDGSYAYHELQIGRAAQLNLQVSPTLDGATAITGLEIGLEVSQDDLNWAEVRMTRQDTGVEAVAHQMPAADNGDTILFSTERARGAAFARIRYRAYGGTPVKAGDTLTITGYWW